MNLENIISQLLEHYTVNPELDLSNLKNIIEAYDGQDYKELIEYSKLHYNRVVVFRNAEFEVLLLCWKPQQASGFHKHSSNGCIMKVLEGTISEERKHPRGKMEIFKHSCGTTIYMANALGTHRVFNETDSKVVSLHIYSPSGFHG